MRDFVRYWLPVLAWNALVLFASTDPFSAQHTGSILRAITTYLFGPLQPQTFEVLHVLVRKSAHLTEYGLLGLLWFRAWRGDHDGYQWNWGLAALGMVLVTAIADEVHQSFVPSRGPSPYDVLLDLTGAAIVQVVLWLAISRRTERKAA